LKTEPNFVEAGLDGKNGCAILISKVPDFDRYAADAKEDLRNAGYTLIEEMYFGPTGDLLVRISWEEPAGVKTKEPDMLTAQDAKRIRQNMTSTADYIAFTELSILRAALEGKTDMVRGLPDKPEDARRLLKILTELDYEVDDQETLNGEMRPGTIVKISWNN
jgi:hypothetical protein